MALNPIVDNKKSYFSNIAKLIPSLARLFAQAQEMFLIVS